MSSSSKPWGDIGDNLSTFFSELDNQDRKTKLENEVRELRATLRSLKATTEKLTKKLNEKDDDDDDDASPTVEKRPKVSDNSDVVVVTDKSEVADIRQKMELYKLCQGMSAVKLESGSGKLTLKFHPISEGKIFGPYQVRNLIGKGIKSFSK